jgi:hypothetical protein
MSLIPTVYDRIEDVPADDWASVCTDPLDLAMDRRLLGTFQSTIGDQCRCWFAIFRDESQRPVAAAGLGLFQVDALETSGPKARAVALRIRRAFPGYMRFGVMFCGLPLPSGASHVRWVEGTNLTELTESLDVLLRELARQNRARLVVIKELDSQQSDSLSGLKNLRYLQGEIPLTYDFRHKFKSLDEYLAALQSGYRKQITRSQKRFVKAGASIEVVTGAAIAARFTDEVYALYLATRDKAEFRMETFPAEFFRETGRRFGDDASLTLLSLDNRVVGWTFGIYVGDEYHNLYIGIDYARNTQADVYFNLYYHDLDRVFRRGCTCMHMGQTSDEFKVRLGAAPRNLTFYVRAVNGVVHAGLRRAAPWVFPPVVRVPPRDIYLTVNVPKKKNEVQV